MFREKRELDAWAAAPFASNAERMRAYADPEYRNGQNEAYRQAVYAKESITEGGVIGGKSYNNSKTVYFQGDKQNAEIDRAQTEDLKSVEQQMRELYGAASVAPPKAAPEPKPAAPVSQWFR